jgi:hypothetical protein
LAKSLTGLTTATKANTSRVPALATATKTNLGHSGLATTAKTTASTVGTTKMSNKRDERVLRRSHSLQPIVASRQTGATNHRRASLNPRRRSKSAAPEVTSKSLRASQMSVSSLTDCSDDSHVVTRSMAMTKPRLTAPVTPAVLKRRAVSTFATKAKSREQLELEKVAELRRDMDEKRKMAAASYQTMLAGPAAEQ